MTISTTSKKKTMRRGETPRRGIDSSHVVLFRVPAIEIRQGPRRRLYSFAIDGKRLGEFATLSRLRREEAKAAGNNAGSLLGYQRPEVASHIAEIRRYIEGPDPLIPNALVVAFDDRVWFEPFEEGDAASDAFETDYSRAGVLHIPVPKAGGDHEKPGWIVDGQQRTAAIREADVASFPVCCVGFVAAGDDEQREQFLLVNSTKPLNKSLVYELLPATACVLPKALLDRRLPSAILARLNLDVGSPLKDMIATPTNPNKAPVKDNSVLKMLANSLTDGALYRLRQPDGTADVEAMLVLLKSFWAAVRQTFPEAWGLPPRRSRLMHGAGVVGMGFLMDSITDRLRRLAGDGREIRLHTELFAADLGLIAPVCRWTGGYWDLEVEYQVRWNELQNTPRDVQRLTDYLIFQYRKAVWSRQS